MAEKVELKRALGLAEVTLSGLGIILGAGIYALIGEAASTAGNALWISFALAALVAVFTGLSYAELSSIFPKASAEYEYTVHAFGHRAAFVVGWLIIFSGAIGASTVSLGFAGYLNALIGTPVTLSAIALLAVLSIITLIGIKQSAMTAMAFTLIESAGLVVIIVLGLPYLGSVDYLEMPLGLAGVFQASALIFFAFIGFEEIVKLAEETREPEKNIPRGLILAVSMSIVFYILVAISAVSVLGWEKLSQSSAPFADIASAAFGQEASPVLAVVALFATSNTVLLMLLAASRITYGMAHSGSLPAMLSIVHPKTRTPIAAILAVMVLSMLFLSLGKIGFVAGVTNFTLFVTFIVINGTLIVLRRRIPTRQRPFRVPLNLRGIPIPTVFGVLINLFLLTQLSIEVIVVGTALTILGGLFSLATKRP
jgi:basic amino acid/polyamine antiporter, APA family